MAKKKSTHKSKDNDSHTHQPHEQNQAEKKQLETQEVKPKTLTLERQPTMEEEKLQNLKNLNAMLLKETFERRQQVETLVHAKEALEAELSQSGVEKSELEGRLSLENDKIVSFEIEDGLFRFLVREGIEEMGARLDIEKFEREEEVRVLKSEVEKERERLSEACKERDLARKDFDSRVKEVNGLEVRLVEMERKERKFEDEVLMLKKLNERLIKEMSEKAREIEAVKQEKGLVEKRLTETLKEIDGLKGEVEGISREKKEIEKGSSEQKVRINELEKDVARRNEVVLDLQKEEKVLREKLLELEKSYSEALEKGEKMAMMINVLSGEKDEKERSVEGLMREKADVFRRLEMAVVEVNDKEEQIEKLNREKNEIEERKASQESEIVELHKEINDLKDSVSALKKLSTDQEDRNKQLVSEVKSFKNAQERAEHERDDARKCLVEEKKNGIELELKISDLEKKIGDNVKELSKIGHEYDVLVKEKKKMEERIGLLTKEKESMQKTLLEAQQSVDNLRAKMELLGVNSDRALTMLRSIAAKLCQTKDEKDKMVVNERNLEVNGEADPYTAELGVIENAFRSKENMVEDMKKQLELVKNSLAEANKKKNLWTLISSAATALLVALSAAYVSKIR